MSDGKLIYFVRHGETAWNSEMRIQGRNDISLNDKGIEQARRIAARLENSPARIVCSSPLQRAAQTAKIIAQDKREIVFWQELQEQDYGAWEGKSLPDVVEKYGADYVRWKHFVQGAEITDGETEAESFSRARTVISKLAARTENEIIVVTHGGILKIILTALLGIETKPLLWNCFVGNCSVSAVQTNGTAKAMLLFLNDCTHFAVKAPDETALKQKIRALPLLV